MKGVTEKQRVVLRALVSREGAVTARELADELELPAYRSSRFTYDEVYGQLKALARKGLARRLQAGRPRLWIVTDRGKREL